MAEGVRRALPHAEPVICPMADGGEGTVEAISAATGGELRRSTVKGPLPGQSVEAAWAYLAPEAVPEALSAAGNGPAAGIAPTAIIEMAQASGILLVPVEQRNPMKTSTAGTGQLIKEALHSGCRRLIVGIGGSATVDGGMGMAHELGYRFLDAQGEELVPGGEAVARIAAIDGSGRDPLLEEASFLVASDVSNPLSGPDGGAPVFGPQKGATPEQVKYLDDALRRFGETLERDLGVRVAGVPGGGAAGGLGAGLIAFCGASLTSGVKLIASIAGLAEKISGADLVLSGEGSYDHQTAGGKTPAGVTEIAREARVPAVIIAGRLSGDGLLPHEEGVGAFCIAPGPMDLESSMKNAAELLSTGTARLMRLLTLID